MKLYTVYDTNLNQAVAEGKPYPTDEGAEIPGLDPNLVFLEEIRATPPYDPATEKLGSYGTPVYDTNAGTATRSREVVALSADELAAALRESKRETMRQNWAGLPANVRANYQPLFSAVQGFLDNNEDSLAVIAVQEVDPIKAIADDPSGRLVAFEATRTQFINAINNLTP